MCSNAEVCPKCAFSLTRAIKHFPNQPGSNMIRKAILTLPLLLVWALLPGTSLGQDFEEWLRINQQQFDGFREEQNRAFEEMLRQHWELVDGVTPESFLKEEKPPTSPVLKPDTVSGPAPDPDIRSESELPPPYTLPPVDPDAHPPERQKPESKQIELPDIFDFDQPVIQVNFFGHLLDVPFDTSLNRLSLNNPYSAEGIASFWKQLSESDIDSPVHYFKEVQKLMQINDWGTARLIFSTGLVAFSGDRDRAKLYTWFMIIQSGRKARVGFHDEGIVLMLATESHLYGIPFFRFDDRPFFVASFDKAPAEYNRVFTYRADFPGQLLPLSLRIPKIPAFQPDYVNRDFSFSFRDEQIEFQVRVNRNLIAFYEYFPQTELDIYFNAPVSQTTADDLTRSLAMHLEGRTEKETIHLLLHFVQNAFGYKIDLDNFGREKPLFPEETLYYSYSDCEDRAILFSYLVQKLTDLDVVALRYPGHIATAVRFDEQFSGDTINIGGVTYHVCDPTYINAGPGMAMERYQDRVPEIITIENN